MWASFASVILLFLLTAQTQENTKTPQKLEPILASPGDDVELSCCLPYVSQGEEVEWYKEQQDRSPRMIYRSSRYSKLEGTFSGQGPNLTINRVERNDSGIYYCVSNYNLMSGVRLIVTDTPRPSHSLLGPFPLEETLANHSTPLLCLTFDANPTWDNFSWNLSGELSPDQKGVGVIDKDGVFSIWHLEMIPVTERTEEKTHPCLLQENRKTTEVMLIQETGNCFAYLYFGIPLIIILLVLSSILIFRKRRARGNSKQQAEQIPRREIPETNYAEVASKNRNVLSVD